jgi:hypothetical protein
VDELVDMKPDRRLDLRFEKYRRMGQYVEA